MPLSVSPDFANRPMTSFAASDLSPTECYKLTTGLVVPRPIGWIGTLSVDGVSNLAPYSFFQAVATNPPVLMFSTGVNDEKIKDSLANVRATGCFTANLVDFDLGPAMNASAAEVDPSMSEFILAGLTPKLFGTVEAPGVAEAKAVMECRVVNEIEFGSGSPRHVVTFGEVVAIHVIDDILDGTRIDAEKLDAVGRLAGNSYSTTRGLFSMARPE